jgi:hypothetical protein
MIGQDCGDMSDDLRRVHARGLPNPARNRPLMTPPIQHDYFTGGIFFLVTFFTFLQLIGSQPPLLYHRQCICESQDKDSPGLAPISSVAGLLDVAGGLQAPEIGQGAYAR